MISEVPAAKGSRITSKAVFWLLCLYSSVLCASLFFDAQQFPNYFVFEERKLLPALLVVLCFVFPALLFAVSQFSFGYVLGLYFYCMILGYLWLVEFSILSYDHSLAAASIAASGLAFLAPALFIASPIRQRMRLSIRALDLTAFLILAFGAVTLAAGASYNFKYADFTEMYKLREQLELPVWLRYAIPITTCTLLPFAFACLALRRRILGAAASLLLLALFYPVVLNKLSLLAPLWLLFLFVLSAFADVKISVVLSLLLPVSVGVAVLLLVRAGLMSFYPYMQYFSIVNSRMIGAPSIAIELYNDFFANHDLTHFCQINIVKYFSACPYAEPLSVYMDRRYHQGAYNASLFSTEGIASVGLIFAPVSALGCGLIIAIGNRLSSGLPPRFILLSSGVLTQIFLNVPFSTTLLTYGAGLLFLLWYITPRELLEAGQGPSVDQDLSNDA